MTVTEIYRCYWSNSKNKDNLLVLVALAIQTLWETLALTVR